MSPPLDTAQPTSVADLTTLIDEAVDRRLAARAQDSRKGLTIVVFSGDLDKVLAAFTLANTAAASGQDTTLFFTFWGLCAIRKTRRYRGKTLLQRLMTFMTPAGAAGLGTSRMHFAGIGPRFLGAMMRHKQVPALPNMIASAGQLGVRLVACSTSLELMGLSLDELIDGVEVGGAMTCLGAASKTGINLFI